MRSNLPPQQHMSPQMLSDPEDEDPYITSTSPQQDSSGEFVCTYVCECVCVCVNTHLCVCVNVCVHPCRFIMLLLLGMCDVPPL